MENQKLSRELTAIETRTMIAERNAGRLALPLDLVERQLYLIRKALAVLSPEDRRNALDLATVIRAECVDETARVRRRYQAGEDRPVDPDDRAARRQPILHHPTRLLWRRERATAMTTGARTM